MSGLDPKQLLTYVVRPALLRLTDIIPFTHAAEQMVLGTAIAESKLIHLDQLDSSSKPGPAYGLWQMEKITFQDHLRRMNPALEAGIFGYLSRLPTVQDLHWNLLLGAAMCRLLYWHAPEMLPLQGDATSMAALWKKRYNTPLGDGTTAKAIPCFQLACTF